MWRSWRNRGQWIAARQLSRKLERDMVVLMVYFRYDLTVLVEAMNPLSPRPSEV